MTTRKNQHGQTPKRVESQAYHKRLCTLVLTFSVFLAWPLASYAKTNDGTDVWSVQVDRVDSGRSNLEPSFSAAIYESLLEELPKTGQFGQVFRSGDRNADAVADLLILKITISKYAPGSETMRAVTTFKGTTWISARVQLTTRDGHVVLEQSIGGNVKFLGNNLRATHNLAHNVAKTLKHSILAGPGMSALAQQARKDPILLP